MAMMCGGPDNWIYLVGNGKVTPDMPQYDGIVRAYLHGAKGIDVVTPPGVLPILPDPMQIKTSQGPL